jgi:hypothetical protein
LRPKLPPLPPDKAEGNGDRSWSLVLRLRGSVREFPLNLSREEMHELALRSMVRGIRISEVIGEIIRQELKK